MALRLLRPCAYPGCPELVSKGTYCDKHKPKQYDRMRGSSNERGYDYRWQKIRERFLSMPNNALCHDCLNMIPEKITPATEVHHIVAKRNGGTDRYSNLMGLCHDCHSKRTAKGE